MVGSWAGLSVLFSIWLWAASFAASSSPAWMVCFVLEKALSSNHNQQSTPWKRRFTWRSSKRSSDSVERTWCKRMVASRSTRSMPSRALATCSSPRKGDCKFDCDWSFAVESPDRATWVGGSSITPRCDGECFYGCPSDECTGDQRPHPAEQNCQDAQGNRRCHMEVRSIWSEAGGLRSLLFRRYQIAVLRMVTTWNLNVDPRYLVSFASQKLVEGDIAPI